MLLYTSVFALLSPQSTAIGPVIFTLAENESNGRFSKWIHRISKISVNQLLCKVRFYTNSIKTCSFSLRIWLIFFLMYPVKGNAFYFPQILMGYLFDTDHFQLLISQRHKRDLVQGVLQQFFFFFNRLLNFFCKSWKARGCIQVFNLMTQQITCLFPNNYNA